MMRRAVDLIVSAVAIVILAPVFGLISLLVLIVDGRPIFFVQRRADIDATPFRMIKFRTMRSGAERSGGSLTFRADQRITTLGRTLRRFKLDELPQFVNVLLGEMTLIGPRPEVLDWAERYTPQQRKVFSVKPGLTDPVQIVFRHEQDFLTNSSEYEELVAIKIQRQIEYIQARSPWTDLVTAIRTICLLFPGKPSQEELDVYAAIKAAATKPAPGR